MATNPALADLQFLAGGWDMELSGAAFLPDKAWRLWRHTPDFSQRFDAQVSTDQAEINGRWEKSYDGGVTWEHDFNIRYARPASA
jgi:hypothetical protein